MTEKRLIPDLHMHSTFSDGTDTPAELLANVRKAGIDIFSLTDHDAIEGCTVLQSLLAPDDPAFLPGVEFSCKDEEGKYHILGYGYDPASPSIRGVVELGHGYRIKKMNVRLEYLLENYGFRFPDEDVKALYALSNPGKPHLGNLMVKLGYAKSKEQAIRDYINKVRVSKEDYVRPEEAISGILGAGGVPVLAHPSYGDGDQLILGEELERRVDRLTDFGLRGLEAFYSGFTPSLRAQVLRLAEKKDLYVTAGSDYHGRNKLIAPADTGLDADGALPDGFLRFLKDTVSRYTPEKVTKCHE